MIGRCFLYRANEYAAGRIISKILFGGKKSNFTVFLLIFLPHCLQSNIEKHSEIICQVHCKNVLHKAQRLESDQHEEYTKTSSCQLNLCNFSQY